MLPRIKSCKKIELSTNTTISIFEKRTNNICIYCYGKYWVSKFANVIIFNCNICKYSLSFGRFKSNFIGMTYKYIAYDENSLVFKIPFNNLTQLLNNALLMNILLIKKNAKKISNL